MLDLNKKKAAVKNPNILDPLETQISATDRQIGQLCNLTETEVAASQAPGVAGHV